jgi:hypothetical protein
MADVQTLALTHWFGRCCFYVAAENPFHRYQTISYIIVQCCCSAASHLATHFFRLLSETMHSTSSNRQFVHGAPCSTTLQRTLRALQHWQAFDARRLTLFAGRIPGFRPAASAVRFGTVVCIVTDSAGEPDESDMLSIAIDPIVVNDRACIGLLATCIMLVTVHSRSMQAESFLAETKNHRRSAPTTRRGMSKVKYTPDSHAR